METSKKVQRISMAAAAVFTIIACIQGYRNIGLTPVIIVGGAGIIGFVFWYFTYLKKPVDPRRILPLFLLTVAALEAHMAEEYLTGFGPAMSRLFDISWTEQGFLMIFAFILPVIYSLTALGLYYRVPIAGFFAWFIFIGPGFAEFTHFIFPLIEPQIDPANLQTVTHVINGKEVTDMPNYYFKTTGHYYFSGMFTAILPMIPGSFAIWRFLNIKRQKVSAIA
jgi:hypothetical protein